MKFVLSLFLSLFALTSFAQELHEAGVSKALAEYRKATVKHLRYEMLFDIPEQKGKAIKGCATLRFDLDKAQEVIIDFRADKGQIKRVKTNGRVVKYRFEAEHIIVPAAQTHAGANVVEIDFIAGNQSLNRRDDMLYTLFVPDRARTAFPCFDQPDLKARYTLTLNVPAEWSAVSNTAETVQTKAETVQTKAETVQNSSAVRNVKAKKGARRTIRFQESEPLPTYLFAFAAGKFAYATHTADGRTIGAFYRETDPKRIAQLPEIFRQVEFALKWQEDFTGVKYPFAKYDLVILPGFQFGGMEHTGATFYNDNTIFLSENPTPDEILNRCNLIAHETTHMWFGDYVTMRWFDDVWTKEVFANYFAAEITAPLFPEVNHDINRLKTYAAAAYSEDRTWSRPLTLSTGETLRGGGTSIRQPLDNLRNAGLVYNNIIYNKAPLMMRKIVEIMGHEAFRESIREYVKTFAYGNATWDELVDILDRHTDHDMKAFSKAWVNEKGMPTIRLALNDDHHDADLGHALIVSQTDPHKRNLLWPQSFAVRLHKAEADTTLHVTLDAQAESVVCPISDKWDGAQIMPNADGRGYGVFQLDANQLQRLLGNWQSATQGTERQAVLMNLHENYLIHNIERKAWIASLVNALQTEDDALTASTICRYLYEPLLLMGAEGEKASATAAQGADTAYQAEVEGQLRRLAETHTLTSVRTQLIRLLNHVARSESSVEWLLDMWEKHDNRLLSVRDYMSMSYVLSIRLPRQAERILSVQRERLTHPADGSAPNADRVSEFDFISRAAVSDTEKLDALFAELLIPENRRIEPWTASVIALLNHPLREAESVKYITPALEALEDVQRTGDIFFPANWCSALLGDHTSAEARRAVEDFLNAHPDYLPLRRNKILNGAYELFR